MWAQIVPKVLGLTNSIPENVSQNASEVEKNLGQPGPKMGPEYFRAKMVPKNWGLHVPAINQQLSTKFGYNLT